MHFRERGLINVQHDYLEHVISILSRYYKYILREHSYMTSDFWVGR